LLLVRHHPINLLYRSQAPTPLCVSFPSVKAAEIKLRAARRVGVLLGPKQEGKRVSSPQSGELKSQRAAEFRKLAAVPQEQFEAHVAGKVDKGAEIKLRAARRVGELLPPKAKPPGKRSSDRRTISRQRAAEFRKLAAVKLRAARRVGELLPPKAPPGRGKKNVRAPDNLPRQRAAEFRKLAAVKLRAARRVGELLPPPTKRGGKPSRGNRRPPPIAAVGGSSRAAEFRKLADVPQEQCATAATAVKAAEIKLRAARRVGELLPPKAPLRQQRMTPCARGPCSQ